MPAEEITQFSNFLQQSKLVFLIGENNAFYDRNNSIASLLESFGGGIINIKSANKSEQSINAPFNVSSCSIIYGSAGGFDSNGNGSFITDDGAGIECSCSALYFEKETLENVTDGILISVLDVNFFK